MLKLICKIVLHFLWRVTIWRFFITRTQTPLLSGYRSCQLRKAEHKNEQEGGLWLTLSGFSNENGPCRFKRRDDKRHGWGTALYPTEKHLNVASVWPRIKASTTEICSDTHHKYHCLFSLPKCLWSHRKSQLKYSRTPPPTGKGGPKLSNFRV